MIESERIFMRKLSRDDFDEVAVFLRDPEVMYAWGHGFSDEEIYAWLDRNIARCERDGCGVLLASDKESGDVIGAIGLIKNPDIDGREYWELLYILKREAWGKGYAQEGSRACIDFALDELGADEVAAQMRVENKGSAKVAEAVGMKWVKDYDRVYNGEVEPHSLFVYKRGED